MPINPTPAQPDPFGAQLDGQGRLIVDNFTNPPAVIPAIIRGLVASNEGYFIEQVFNVPGMTVDSGFISYQETFPEDHFLDPGASIAPRAAGSEAPRIGIKGRAPKMAFPESWSGSLEVTDEQRRWNKVLEVQETFRRAANTFADVLQTRGETVLGEFTDATNRYIIDPPGSDWAAAKRVEDTTGTVLPGQEFARVKKTFLADKAGQQPDLLLTSLDEAEHLDRIYGDRLDAVLNRYGLTLIASPRRPNGRRIYCKRRAVGTIAFDKPLGTPEVTREGQRFTDVYTMEVVPVFVAHGADAILEVRET